MSEGSSSDHGGHGAGHLDERGDGLGGHAHHHGRTTHHRPATPSAPSPRAYSAHAEANWGAGATQVAWDGARLAPLPPLLHPVGETLDVGATLAGKTILLIGTTGFVGKVALSMLLFRYPQIGRVYCLVRPGAGNTADERFFKKVATSHAFDPLRQKLGAGFEPFMREKIVAIAGDIGRPLCNFSDAQFAEFAASGGVDVLVNSAGLVSFMPSLESALRINANGAKNVLETARRLGSRLVHVSTCYVAGRRDGEVWEDEPIVGYFPRNDELLDKDFDPAAEIVDCQRIIDQARDRGNDRAHISEFRDRAYESLKQQRRDPDDEDDLKLAVARERKLWMNDVLTKLGMERSIHWGWTNTYTYTKSLGEQVILADPSVVSTIVRPAIVESAVRYPFAGWNEGFNTTAPLVYLVLKGHRSVPVGESTALDAIPVDFIAAGMWLATAAILRNEHQPVYQLGSSDSNRVTSRRLVELTALGVRKHYRDKVDRGEDKLRSRIRARLEGLPVNYTRFNNTSAPMVKRVADRLTAEIDERLPRWGAPRLEAWAERAKDELAKISRFTGQVIDLVDLFRPFNHDHDITFRCDNIRQLWARCTPEDQEALLWAPHLMDWRHYWLEVHFKGLQKWTFDKLDEEFGEKPRSVYTHKTVNDMFLATAKAHQHRVALRLLPSPDHEDDPIVFNYGQVEDLAWCGAAFLKAQGIAIGSNVMVMSENRPEWGITYFATLLAGATSVPLDSQLTIAEVVNLAKVSRSRALVVSKKVAERLCGEAHLLVPVRDQEKRSARFDARGGEWAGSAGPEGAGRPLIHDAADRLGEERIPAHHALEEYLATHVPSAPKVVAFAELLAEGEAAPNRTPPPIKSDSVASILFTSGTTGTPKGVMLSHKNFTAMVAKLSSMFSMYKHDRMLSVLPLHHTFEFSTGFLMPLHHGSSITYLEEVEADALAEALEHEGITSMVGVPALWQLLERKIYKRFSDVGVLAERAFESIVDVNRTLRDKLPWDLGTGKLLFFPVHRKLGGRMRLLISGGSALPADTMKSFRGLGFDLYEGYGMTEAAPVITVTRPGDSPIPGSVGRALPGVDVKIDKPDAGGVGEVLAKGPSVMAGYFENEEASAAALEGGWLHTGDLGRFDEEGNLFIVGRKKEMILGASGENIYPDELEDAYKDSPYIKELSVVGLPGEQGLETVAALVVPEYDQEGMDREAVREAVREHLRKIGKSLPQYKRLKVMHLWDHDLPKTSTRKVKRREIVKELTKLERAAKGGAELKKATEPGASVGWVVDLITEVSQAKRGQVTAETTLAELGFDSLMFSELTVALEAAGVELPDPTELTQLERVGDVEALLSRLGNKMKSEKPRRDRLRKEKEVREAGGGEKREDDIDVPTPLVRLGRRVLRQGMRSLYSRVLSTKIHGAAQVPPFGGYIVAANHSSHLDTGLVKYALGEQGDALVALAARDYFFDDPVRRAYFENFTNLVPMERHGSLRESLRLAGEVIQQGYVLLIFPEGTRSDTGVMSDFKPSLGYLALTNRCGILPMYLSGTHEAMPKGRYLPKRGERVAAHVGPFVTYEQVLALAATRRSRSEQYRAVTHAVESVVRRLAPDDQTWTLGEAGTTPLAEYLAAQGGEGHPVDGDGEEGGP
jgi:long-chain acyl-CoA synthetase